MPLYNYQCNKCNDTFETIQAFSDKPLITCKKCGGNLKKLISKSVGIIFKGTGFYCNDK